MTFLLPSPLSLLKLPNISDNTNTVVGWYLEDKRIEFRKGLWGQLVSMPIGGLGIIFIRKPPYRVLRNKSVDLKQATETLATFPTKGCLLFERDPLPSNP